MPHYRLESPSAERVGWHDEAAIRRNVAARRLAAGLLGGSEDVWQKMHDAARTASSDGDASPL